MGIEEDRKLEDRHRKKLILLAGDSPFWKEIGKLESRAHFSLAALRNAALPERYAKAKKRQAKDEGRKGRSAAPHPSKSRLARDIPIADLHSLVSRLRPDEASSREDLLGVSTETLRKMLQGLLKPGNRAHLSLDALREALFLALRYFDNPPSDVPASAPPDTAAEVLADRQWCATQATALMARVTGFIADLDDSLVESKLVYDAGWEFLGLGIKETQERIDTALFATRPLLIKPYFNDWDTAQKAFKEVEGFFHAWLGRFADDDTIWMRCCVHVRYVIQLGGGFVIRAKLNVPIFNPGSADHLDGADGDGGKVPAHEYDGFCDVQAGGRVYWVWEKRSRSREDYAFWITTPPLKEGYRMAESSGRRFTGCTGHYLTCHQDTAQTIVEGPLILEPDVDGPRIRADYEVMARKKMWGDPMAVRPGHPEFKRINDLAAALGLKPHRPDGA